MDSDSAHNAPGRMRRGLGCQRILAFLCGLGKEAYAPEKQETTSSENNKSTENANEDKIVTSLKSLEEKIETASDKSERESNRNHKILSVFRLLTFELFLAMKQ